MAMRGFRKAGRGWHAFRDPQWSWRRKNHAALLDYYSFHADALPAEDGRDSTQRDAAERRVDPGGQALDQQAAASPSKAVLDQDGSD